MSVKNQEKRREKVVCPCQSGKAYYECCEVYHQGEIPITAESLMRSRFTAFTYQLEAYLSESWHSSTRPEKVLTPDSAELQWFFLKIIKTEPENSHGEHFVTFEARYRENGRANKFTERSRFIVEAGKLRYIDGEFL